ncbi:MAG TPA: chemotaxis protein CheB [Blastocatellia bacterium]|nr:chemotaxis protein CheB [Blastocatellia bacterium]
MAPPRKYARQHEPDTSTAKKRGEERQAVNTSFPVVGIGASAGGLEAFRQLLERLPVDTGMAFVLVQHLDPTHDSILTELLSRSTQMPVSEVRDGMAVAPDHVYVIPRNSNMTIAGGVLRLLPREEARGRHRPIDYFLRALAEDQSHRAIGVILSGTASDGTLGLEAIKAEGGITFAEDPKSAKYDSMPRSAIAAGHVDFILTPKDIARELARLSRHPYVTPPADTATIVEEEVKSTGLDGFRQILALLRKAKGVDFTDYKTDTLHRRITRRMMLSKLESLEGYAQYLRENEAEVEALYQDILINVTSFFRDPETFSVLKERIFPKIVEHRAPDEPIRIWSLGCSTGEEAYSIAMSFVEFAGDQAEHIPIQIFATDISDKGIEKARAGVYSKDIAGEVSPERLRRFFTEAEGGYRISKPIRDLVVFARQNVLADPPFSRLDLISCRNLLIYLEPVLQKQVLPALHYALKPTGVLWLGSSETVGSASDLFTPVDKKRRFYAKKLISTRLRFHSAAGDSARDQDGFGRKTNRVAEPAPGGHDSEKEADRILLARYCPASVLINPEMEILQFRGSTAPYLEAPSGKATLNLLKMAREGLMLPLRAAIQKAKKDDVTVRKEGVRFNGAAGFRQVNLEVVPIKGLAANERCFLVLFDPAPSHQQTPGQQTKPREAQAGRTKRKTEDRQVARLQEELAATREYLQSLIEQQEVSNEELQSSSEEAQSSNEELQSINEELETSKEELESSNEELATLNDELHNRNLELAIVNDDLNNLNVNVNIPLLMLDRDLRIRRFTPQAEKVLSLISTDMRRPIGDIKFKINIHDLEALIVEVIDTVSAKELEAQDTEGRWYSMRVRPYKTLDNKIDGAVIALVDIDALKRSEAEIQEARDYAEAIVRTTRDPLLILNADLRVHTANEAYYYTFKVSPAESEGRLIYDLSNGQWNIPRLRELLEDILPRNSFFNDFEVTHDFETIGRRTMLLNARKLSDASGQPARILLGIQDITELKRAQEALRESAERFRFMAESMPQKIFTAQSNGEVDYFNRQWTEFTGLSFEQIKVWDWTRLIHPDDVEETVRRWQRSMDTGEPFQFEHRFRRADDEYRWHLSRAHAMRDSEGKVLMWIGSNTDIDYVKRAEAERELLLASEQQARQEAETANHVKDEFLATLSHELRSPLNSIQGWADLLLSGGLDEQAAARAIEIIARNARAQNQLIADLLDVSRITTGKLRFETGVIDLIQVIEAAAETVRPAAEAKGVELQLRLDPAAGPVSGDDTRLQQVVWNLLSNAIRSTPRGGRVEMRLERDGAQAAIIVRDTGEGISADLLPHIFDRFRQADGTTTRQHGGLGLGLAIVRHLVEAHGGQVNASSEGAGHGATFKVKLPLMALPNADFGLRNGDVAKPSAVHRPQSAILAGLRVLVVDDQEDVRELLRLALTLRGAEVRVGATAREALDILDKWQPDVLVSDIGMPDEDGYGLIRQVRALPAERGGQIPAVALTGYASDKDAARVIEAGYQTFAPKPVDLAELAAEIARLAERTGKI